MKSLAFALVLVCAMVASASARELGERGAVSINGSFQLALSSVSSDASNSKSTTILKVAPNGDLFIAPNVSLGLGVSVQYTSIGDSSHTDFGVDGRFGYYLPLGTAGIWLLAGVAYTHGETQVQIFGPITGSADADRLTLELYVPIVLELAPNFFFGLGPVLTQDIQASDSTTGDAKFRVLGIASTVGGVW